MTYCPSTPQRPLALQASAAVAVLVRICGEDLALSLKKDFCLWSRQKLAERETKGWCVVVTEGWWSGVHSFVWTRVTLGN